MAIIENLDKKYIFLHRDFGNKEDVFHFINGILLEDGYVTEEYLPKVLERENTFPTGMELEKINVAIPHIDSKYILKENLFEITSKKGIEFNNAENNGEKLNVKIIFGLLIREHNTHINFLVKLIELFQENDKLEQILESSDKDEVIKILKDVLK